MQSEVDAFQPTPLHLASKNGDMDIVRALLENNTSACLVYDNNEFIPLHYAVISGQIEIMQELINARPQSIWMKLNDGFLNTTDDKGNTILDLSMMLRQKEMVEYLLSIPKLICGTNLTNFTASNATKEGTDLQKTKARKPKRQKKNCVVVHQKDERVGDGIKEKIEVQRRLDWRSARDNDVGGYSNCN
ncbi:hypothetical protein SDJN03_21828, partial [Cucurbita argyrosperma subsp. sororia]